MADPRYSYQFTADAPPLAFPVSQGYAPAVDYVPPTLPELELNQLLNGQPIGISPFGPRYVEPSPVLEDGDISDYGGVPSAEELAFAVGGPGGAYAAYRAGQAARGMYDDAIAAERYAAQGSQRVRPGSTYQAGDWYKWVTPPLAQEYLQGSTAQGVAAQPALPVGASRAALPPGADQLALPPRPTFSTPRDRVMYDLENAALRERYSPDRVPYPTTTRTEIENLYEPFDSARRKIINRGDDFRAGTYTPGKYELTPEELAIWNRASSESGYQMDNDARRAKKPSKETGLGSKGKAALQRLANYASKAGSTAMSAAGFTGILSQLVKPDPFDPIGNYIIRSNPEAYPEQVKQYNEAVSNVWY